MGRNFEQACKHDCMAHLKPNGQGESLFRKMSSSTSGLLRKLRPLRLPRRLCNLSKPSCPLPFLACPCAVPPSPSNLLCMPSALFLLLPLLPLLLLLLPLQASISSCHCPPPLLMASAAGCVCPGWLAKPGARTRSKEQLQVFRYRWRYAALDWLIEGCWHCSCPNDPHMDAPACSTTQRLVFWSQFQADSEIGSSA